MKHKSKSDFSFCMCSAELNKYELSVPLSSAAICTPSLNYILDLGRLAALNWWGWFQAQKRSRFAPGGNVHTNSFTNANKPQSPRVHNISSENQTGLWTGTVILIPHRVCPVLIQSVCKLYKRFRSHECHRNVFTLKLRWLIRTNQIYI